MRGDPGSAPRCGRHPDRMPHWSPSAPVPSLPNRRVPCRGAAIGPRHEAARRNHSMPARVCLPDQETATGVCAVTRARVAGARRAAQAPRFRRTHRGSARAASAKHEPGPASRPMDFRHRPASRALPSSARMRHAQSGTARSCRPRTRDHRDRMARRTAATGLPNRQGGCSARLPASAGDGWRRARVP